MSPSAAGWGARSTLMNCTCVHLAVYDAPPLQHPSDPEHLAPSAPSPVPMLLLWNSSATASSAPTVGFSSQTPSSVVLQM